MNLLSLIAAALLFLGAQLAEQPAHGGGPKPVSGAPGAAGAAVPKALPAPESLVEEKRLLAAIKSLPVRRAARGGAEDRAGLIATQDLLVKDLRALGYEPELQEVDFVGSGHDKEHPLYNITIDITGKEAPDHFYIVSCHFDAVPGAPGADDDGSGVGAVLEMARILKDRPMKNTVRLCFFNLEELGLVGSSRYVEEIAPKVRDKSITILGMVSLDMIGYYSTEPKSQRSPLPKMEGFEPPTVGDFLAMGGVLRHRVFSQSLDKAMRRASPELRTVVVDFLPIALPDMMRSDHAPFLGIGVPALIVSDTANFRSPHYHKPSDAVGTLDMGRLTVAVRGLVGAVYELAGPVEVAAPMKAE